LVNLLYRTRYTDLCYGYNAFWRRCLPGLCLDCDGFEIEALLNIRAARTGLTVRDVASYEERRLHGRSDLMSKARARGYLPVLSWGSYAAGEGTNQPGYRLSEIVGGRYDAFIRRWATGAKNWGHPFLRFDWEMNTNSVPYSEHSNGNRRGEFVRMWRHVHRIFTRVGAENVTWVWCPNVEYSTSVKPLASLYPGDSYVDWTCLDGYNWGTNRAGTWRTSTRCSKTRTDSSPRRSRPPSRS
jgi:hypothetical protein